MKLQRLPEWRIKNGILHPDQGVRQEALGYFADSLSEDHTVMPLAVQAVDTWGWGEAFEFPHVMTDLAQTEETLPWLVRELARTRKPDGAEEALHRMHLSRMIAAADARLLARHEASIMGLEGLGSSERDRVAERIELLGSDTEYCWEELERFCDEGKRKTYVNEVNLEHAYNLVEAVARNGSPYADRVLNLLSEEIDSYTDNPMAWMEGLAARLAGEMRLEAAVSLLVEKLHVDGDWTNEQCARALTRMGSDSAVELIAQEYPNSELHYRIYAAGVLEDTHSDASLKACLRLFDVEDDLDLRFGIGHAILRQYSAGTINAMREFILNTPPHRERNSMRDRLVAVAALTGDSFPEYEEWQALARDVREDQRATSRELLALRAAPGQTIASGNEPEPRARSKPGRNSPCPCG
ncbi:MAG: hypothetical protein MUQ26_02255, partial [Armatimonadetes bacterium]|nr:hypothetical protein [Armatimonadota bacterium]